jgi:hypothetical protein
MTKVKFGSVTVRALSPAKASLSRNVISGQAALVRATSKILRPGVVLTQGPDVPVYHADPKVPGQIVRELNGKLESGNFVNGKFRLKK